MEKFLEGNQISAPTISAINLSWHAKPAFVDLHRRVFKLSIKIMRDRRKRSHTYISFLGVLAPLAFVITAPVTMDQKILLEHQYHWLIKLKNSFAKIKSQKTSNLSSENCIKSSYQRRVIQMNWLCSLVE
jgi:hypothetical protein